MATRRRGTSRKRSAPGTEGTEDPTRETPERETPKRETRKAGATLDAASRFEALREAVGNLRTRGSSVNVERPLLIAGAVLLPLGLVAIVLGWLGASRTPYTFEQVPYLISGGLLGVALAITGGFLYFGYWLTRMVNEQREQSRRLTDALERVEEALGGGPQANGGSSSRGSRTGTAS